MPAQTPRAKRQTLFAVPEPIRRLFNTFPLVTLPAEALPACAPAFTTSEESPAETKRRPVLYVFSDAERAAEGLPSWNPSCLKWQTYLKFANQDFILEPSTNHSSPTGALPFLLPASSSSPVPSSKLQSYISSLSQKDQHNSTPNPKIQTFSPLLDHHIRLAYLHALYLCPENTPLLKTLYVDTTSSNPLIRLATLHTLRHAAAQEILSSHPSTAPSFFSPSTVQNNQELYKAASEALHALSETLGTDLWFFASPEPTIFDASFFAYAHVLLDSALPWANRSLPDTVASFPNLVAHHKRILDRFFAPREVV